VDPGDNSADEPLTEKRKRVAVMQPYFFPYAGYFRLFSCVDQFVIFDCVQFPRRGRVHRTEVPGPNGKTEWLTLPLARQERSILIRDLQFAADARRELDKRLARHTWLLGAEGPRAERIREYLFGPLGSVLDFLEQGLRLVLDVLGFESAITRSSVLGIEPTLHGQERVIAIVNEVGGTAYLNLPGGRTLYRGDAFAEQGIELSFLPPYSGRYFQLLYSLLEHPPELLRRDIAISAS